MRNRILGALVAVMVSVPCVSIVAGTISGKVTDMSTGEPMEFVNVTVSKKDGTELPMGTMSEIDGSYKLTGLPVGEYDVKFSFVGYDANVVNVAIASSSENVALKPVKMKENAHMLDEIEVVGMKSQMRFDLDKRVFNVDQNIAAAGASASEILETVPSVEVDDEGSISLRGNSSVTVWINGKPSGLTADNQGQILEQLPAETIEKIELITNPSAKYSPEGTAGIINIVLKQNRQPGYFGGAQAGGNTQGGFNVGGNINFNINKWDAYANVGVRSFHSDGYENSWRNYTDGTYLNSFTENENRHTAFFFRAGATYHITEADAISLGGFGMTGGGWEKSGTDYESTAPGSFTSGLSDSDSDRDGGGGNVTIDYTHKFNDRHSLMASASYNLWSMPSSVLYHREYYYPEQEDEITWQRQENNIKVNNWEFQLDYSNQFNEMFKIEAGYKGNLSSENSPMTTWSGTSESNMPIDEELYNRFIYDQNIQALYATFGGRIDKFSFSAGLRGEYWHNESKSLAYGEEENAVEPFVTDKFALFPSLFLSYSLPKENEIQVNYTRRIRRPWGGQLNPFVDISDPTNISYGNPQLQPQYANAFELNYIKTWNDHMLSVSGYYRSTDDVIQRISFMKDGVMNNTSENVSQSQEAGVEFVVKNKFFKRLDLTTTVNLFYNALDGFSYLPEGLTEPVTGEFEDDFTWNFNMMASVLLPWDLNLQLSGRYFSRQITAQGSRDPRYRIDGGLKKSIDKWSFSINVRDLLNSRKRSQATYGPTFEQLSERCRGGRRVQFIVSYSFGNAKPRKPEMRPGSMDGDGMGGNYGGMED